MARSFYREPARRYFEYHVAVLFTLSHAFLSRVSGNPFIANMTGKDVIANMPVPDSYVGSAVLNIYETGDIDYVFSQSGLEDDRILELKLETPQLGDPNGIFIFSFSLTDSEKLDLQMNGSIAGSTTVDADQAVGIIQKPEIFYVSVKTDKFPIAAIKGFLSDQSPSPVDGMLPRFVLQANMTGDQVAPNEGLEFGFASANFSLFPVENQTWLVQYDFVELNFSDVKTVAWYNGNPGSVGPLLLNLTPYINIPAMGFNKFSRGYFNMLAVDMQPILANPGIDFCQITSEENPKVYNKSCKRGPDMRPMRRANGKQPTCQRHYK